MLVCLLQILLIKGESDYFIIYFSLNTCNIQLEIKPTLLNIERLQEPTVKLTLIYQERYMEAILFSRYNV